jgi:hypothetical protein
MEAGTGSDTVRADSLKNSKQKRQHHKTRCWRNKAIWIDYSRKTAMIMPVEEHNIPKKKLGFF